MLAMLASAFALGIMICKLIFVNPEPKHVTNYTTNTQILIRTNYATNYTTNGNEVVKEVTITEKESITNDIFHEVKKNNTIGGGIGSGGDGIIYYTHNVFDYFNVGGGVRFNYFNYTNFGVYLFVSYSF